MSKIFACSDTHFGHENIIRYCRRPFENAHHMSESLIERWNSRVAVTDTVYFLGDFAMGRGVDFDYVVGILSRLNGHMKVVLGNHDQPHKKFKQAGLAVIAREFTDVEILSDIHEEQIDGKHFVMCHYMMSDWNAKFHGSIHLHGHCHTQYSPTYISGRSTAMQNRYDVGVDMYGGPVEITGDLRYLNDPRGWE